MNLSFAYIVSFFTQAYKMFCFVALRVASNTLTAYIISNNNKAGGRGLVRVDPKFKTSFLFEDKAEENHGFTTNVAFFVGVVVGACGTAVLILLAVCLIK